ncbi:MAG: metallophosphoesterase [Planctomycetota bacterium]|jgi:hypothetical protein
MSPLLLVAICLGCGGPEPGLTAGAPAAARSRPGPAFITTRIDGRFTILAVTDIHFSRRGESEDDRTITDIRSMVAATDPDILLVNGDTWHDNPRGKGYGFCRRSARAFAGMGVPWAFAWGNHDLMSDYAEGHDLLESAPGSLYRGGRSNGNYAIEVRGSEGNAPVWDVFVMNSGAGGVGSPQLEWFEREVGRLRRARGRDVPAFVFFHIPLPEFAGVWYFTRAEGVMLERGVDSERTSAEAFDVLARVGTVKAVFCGHDHMNCFKGTWRGVHLEYLRATGHAGYGGKKFSRGATLVAADTMSGSFETRTVFPPEPTEARAAPVE